MGDRTDAAARSASSDPVPPEAVGADPTPRAPLYRTIDRRVAVSVERLYRFLASHRITRFPWAVIQTFSRAQGALLSGSMAYYTFLSLLPMLLITTFILGTFARGNVSVRDAIVRVFEQVMPGTQGNEILSELIRSRVAFGLLGAVTLIYAASGFVGSLTACLNRMWNVEAGRNPLGQKLVNLAVVLLLAAVLIGSAAVSLWTAYLTRILLGGSGASTARWIELVASPLSLLAVLLILYRILPARALTIRSQLPGAVAGALGIELLKRAFTYWAQHSAGMAALPRSLLSVVLLLAWMGFFGQVVLYGAALNVVWDRKRRAVPLLPAA